MDDDFAVVTRLAEAPSKLRGFDDGSPYQFAGGPFAVLRNPMGIEVADLNGDQMTDVVVVSEGDQGAGGITILHGNDDCTFSVPAPPADSQVMAGQASSATVMRTRPGDGAMVTSRVRASRERR